MDKKPDDSGIQTFSDKIVDKILSLEKPFNSRPKLKAAALVITFIWVALTTAFTIKEIFLPDPFQREILSHINADVRSENWERGKIRVVVKPNFLWFLPPRFYVVDFNPAETSLTIHFEFSVDAQLYKNSSKR